MKEVLGSLPEVITAYKNYNLLVPTATDVQLNPFYKFHVEEVPVDLGENSGDIFKVGSVKTGKQDERGKDIWEDVFSLSKPLLNKMAMAAGIQFNPKETYGERIDRVTYRAQAQGAMRKADGTARTETDQKVICLEDEEEKYRIEFADKAAKGITDEKQAQAAAEIFSGQWVESKNKWGKKCQAFVVAKEDRDRYIDRSVMVNMALLKKTWAEKAMTGAKLRVIRALLGVKGTYTKAELQKNFAIPTVIFSPDFSDPQVRQAMLTQGMNSVNNMFGTPQIAVKSVDFESESTVFTQDDLNNPAYASDTENEDDYPPMQEPDIAPEPEPEPEPDRSADFQCSRFKSDEYTIYTRLIEGKYFAYQKMFTEGEINTCASRTALIGAMTRAKMCTEEKQPAVFQIEDDVLNISIRDKLADYQEQVPLQETVCKSIRLGFDSRLVLETLKAFTCDNIALGFTSPRTPMIVEAEDSDMKAMVLPVAIREA